MVRLLRTVFSPLPLFAPVPLSVEGGVSLESVLRAESGLEPFKIFHLFGAANVLASSRKNLGRFPAPMLRVPVGKGEIAPTAVSIGRQIPPSITFAEDSRPTGRGHPISGIVNLLLIHIDE